MRRQPGARIGKIPVCADSSPGWGRQPDAAAGRGRGPRDRSQPPVGLGVLPGNVIPPGASSGRPPASDRYPGTSHLPWRPHLTALGPRIPSLSLRAGTAEAAANAWPGTGARPSRAPAPPPSSRPFAGSRPSDRCAYRRRRRLGPPAMLSTGSDSLEWPRMKGGIILY